MFVLKEWRAREDYFVHPVLRPSGRLKAFNFVPYKIIEPSGGSHPIRAKSDFYDDIYLSF
ncbi:hypothetical protein GCM10027050_02870 [Psychrosphaera aestuarii]